MASSLWGWWWLKTLSTFRLSHPHGLRGFFSVPPSSRNEGIMKRAVLAILLLLAVFLVALAGWVFFRPEDPNDPVVNGERMSFWISQLGSEDAHTRAFATENVGSVGPRGPREAAIPALMRLLEDPIPQ